MSAHMESHQEGVGPLQSRHFKCNMCGYTFSQKINLVNHMRLHTGERPFKCTVAGCALEFKLAKTLKDHIRNKHSDIVLRPFKCQFPGCRYAARTSASLYVHRQVHSDDRPFPCPHSGCNNHFKRKQNLKRHCLVVHDEYKTFTCSMCDFKTALNANLKRHMSTHSSRRDFKCSHSQCEKSFKILDHLNRHLSNRHGKRNIPCDHPGCGRKYGNSQALNDHKRYHSKKSYACPEPECNYKTNMASNSATHVIVHDRRNGKISCSIQGCEYKGKHSRALEVHMRRHTTLLACPVSGCGRYVPSKEVLKDHVKLHNPSGRPFQCPLCFQHFRKLSQIQKHCVSHTNEKPFVCGYCDYGNARQAVVKIHISSAHPNIRFPFIDHLPGDRECLRCEVTLPFADYIVHCMGHALPVVMIERIKTRQG